MTLRKIGVFTLPASGLHVARYTSEVTAARVLRDFPQAKAVAAAPMFGRTGSVNCGGGIKPCTKLIDLENGVEFAGSSRLASRGITLSIVNGRAVVKPGNVVEPQASVAVQLYPTLVQGGRNVGSGEVESSVAGLGVTADGRLVSVVAASGSLRQLADELIRRGAIAAGYTDAGSSAALYVRGEGWRGVHARGATGPTLPGWLVFTSGGGGSGGTLVKGVVLAALVAGGSLLAWRLISA